MILTKAQSENLAKIFNNIKAKASLAYQEAVPDAVAGDDDSYKGIGQVITTNPTLQNEQLTALVDMISLIRIESKSYRNPLARLKKGKLDYGTTIENVFIDLAKGFKYDVEAAERTAFKRQNADVRSQFHRINLQAVYETTVYPQTYDKAFLGEAQAYDFISRQIDAVYSGFEYDEFECIKYMIAKAAIKGYLNPIEIVPATDKQSTDDVIETIKGVSNLMEFKKPGYNFAHVRNQAMKESQYLLVNGLFDAKMDVQSLASAFNMDKVEFLGHKIMIDDFGSIDQDRLADIIEDYEPLTAEELTALSQVPAFLADEDWFQIYDRLNMTGRIENPKGLYYNLYYHVWEIMDFSIFANNALFLPSKAGVTSVKVTPATINTLKPGSTLQLDTVVETTNFASKAVDFKSDNDLASVDVNGFVRLDKDIASGTVVTITVTSRADATKKATCKITVA